MKKLAVILLVIVLSVCSCAKQEYHPFLILPNEYSVSGNTIHAELVNVYFFSPYEEFTCADENSKLELYEDDTYTAFLEEGSAELCDGLNKFVLLVTTGEKSASFNIEIYCVMILDFRIEILKDKTYRRGEFFDESTVKVIATKENGEITELKNYTIDYSFNESGPSRVDISCGGIVHSIYVTVE